MTMNTIATTVLERPSDSSFAMLRLKRRAGEFVKRLCAARCWRRSEVAAGKQWWPNGQGHGRVGSKVRTVVSRERRRYGLNIRAPPPPHM